MRNSVSAWVVRVATSLFACIALVHCGGAVQKVGDPGGQREAGADGPEAGTDIGECGANGACPSGSSCFFPIGGCSSKGQCIENPPPDTPECGAIEILCGCDGTTVTSGCGFPDGYASGPTTGHGSCGGVGVPEPDGGIEAGSDGGNEAGDLPDAGTDLGPCGDGGACPSGSSCFYAIGSCDQAGECLENSTGPLCGAEEILCGCNGPSVVTGCGFPQGYASGPTTGTSSEMPCGAEAGADAGM
jgi:hypothetical protein